MNELSDFASKVSSYSVAGQVATDFKHGGKRPEVPLAETQCSGCHLSVQPYGHDCGVCTKGGATGCGKNEEVSP